MGTKITWETAEEMMNIIAYLATQVYKDCGEEIDLEEILQFARETFDDYCKVMNITEVEDPEESFEDDYEFEDEDEESGEDEMESIIYEVDGRRTISLDDANLLLMSVVKTMRESHSNFPEELLKAMIQIEVLRISEDYGIEMVDTEDE